MTRIELVKRITGKTGLTIKALAEKLKVTRPALYVNGSYNEHITQRLLRVALDVGLASDVFNFLIGETRPTNVVLLAAIQFPDLTPEELCEIRRLEDMLGSDRVTSDEIKTLIDRKRSKNSEQAAH